MELKTNMTQILQDLLYVALNSMFLCFLCVDKTVETTNNNPTRWHVMNGIGLHGMDDNSG